MSAGWESRSFREMATSTGEENRADFSSVMAESSERSGASSAPQYERNQERVITGRAPYGSVAPLALEATRPDGGSSQGSTYRPGQFSESQPSQSQPYRPGQFSDSRQFQPARTEQSPAGPFVPAARPETVRPEPLRPEPLTPQPLTPRPLEYAPPTTRTEAPTRFQPSTPEPQRFAPTPVVEPLPRSVMPPNDAKGAPQTTFQPRGEFQSTSPRRPSDSNAPITSRPPYGEVAPIAIEATRPNQPVQPNVGTDGRAPYGVVPPSAVPDNQGYNPNIPGDPGRWQPSPNQVGDNGQRFQAPGSSSSGVASVSPEQRAAIERSLKETLNQEAFLVDAALGGIIGSGPLPWALDKLATNTGALNAVDKVGQWKIGSQPVGRWLTSPGRYYMENHSPLGMQIGAERLNGTEAGRVKGEMLADRTKLITDYKASTLPAEMRANSAAIKTTLAETTKILDDAAALPESAKHAYADKIRFLQDAQANRGAGIPKDLRPYMMDPAAAHPNGRQFLTSAEAEVLAKQRALSFQRADIVGQLDGIKTKLGSAEATLASVEQNVAALKNGGSKFPFWGRVAPPLGADGKAVAQTLAWEARLPPGSNRLERAAGEWRGNNWSNKIGEGLAIGAGILATDHFIDNVVFGNDQKAFAKRDYFLEGPAMAAGILIPKNPWVKVGTTVGLYGAAKIANWAMPGEGPSANYSMIMKPNYIEAIATGAAWMMPFKGPAKRGVALGTAWLLGRGANLANEGLEAAGLPIIPFVGLEPGIPGMGSGGKAIRLNESLMNTVKYDAKTTDHSTFQSMVTKGKDLGMENEGALMLQVADFMNAHRGDTDPVYRLHGTAGLNTAAGDYWMERGAKIVKTAHNKDGRILMDSKLDLGGQALQFYRPAAGSLIEAENHLRDKGDTVKADEMATSRKYVEKQLDTIYGEHNIDKIFADLKSVNTLTVDSAGKILSGTDNKPSAGGYTQNINAMAHFHNDLKGQVDSMRTGDKRYLAKMCRDLALVQLAIADYKADKSDSASVIMYSDALRYLQSAEQLDDKAPDAVKIRQIAETMRQKVQGSTGAQYDSKVNNPFGIQPKH